MKYTTLYKLPHTKICRYDIHLETKRYLRYEDLKVIIENRTIYISHGHHCPITKLYTPFKYLKRKMTYE